IRDGHVTGVQTCALPIWPAQLLDLWLRPAGTLQKAVSLPGRVCAPRERSRRLAGGRARSSYGENRRLLFGSGGTALGRVPRELRSEERRVGKGCRVGMGW